LSIVGVGSPRWKTSAVTIAFPILSGIFMFKVCADRPAPGGPYRVVALPTAPGNAAARAGPVRT
jgi:hypothetical protein